MPNIKLDNDIEDYEIDPSEVEGGFVSNALQYLLVPF